jgi:Putative peptidoglycan binding domain
MATTFPYGYRKDANGVMGMGTMLTQSQLEAQQTVAKLHPEFWRRALALFQAAAKAKVPLGPGTGWRVQPNPPPPGFAKPGNSNHEGFMEELAVAIDTVPEPSWNWMEKNCSAYGVRTFRYVNSEPWHIQPIEIPPGRNYRTTPWKLARFNLPGPPPAPRVPRPVLKRGDKGLGVRRLINQLKFWKWYPKEYLSDKNDGSYGQRCVTGVKNMQRALKVPINGVYDNRTARALRNHNKAMADLAG